MVPRLLPKSQDVHVIITLGETLLFTFYLFFFFKTRSQSVAPEIRLA